MIKKIIALIVALLFALSLSVIAFADFGDFGGDNDFGGGGGFDSGGSYGGGSYDSGGHGSYNNDRDTTEPATTTYYSYKNYPSGNVYDGKCVILNADGEELAMTVSGDEDDDSDTNTVLGAIILGIILIVVATVIKNKDPDAKKNKYKYISDTPVNTGVESERTENLNSISSYTGRDPQFSEVELKEKLSNIYVKLQNAWQDKNLEEIRPYLTDTLYSQYDRQLDAYRRNKQTNYIERIAVLSVDIRGWKESADNDLVVAEIRTRIVDYVVNDENNSLVRGSKTAEKFMTYEWTLSRKKGVKTIAKDGVHTVNCPNCGAPVDINKSAKCEFCGSIITTDSSDWTINSIKALSQRTVGK